MDNHHVVSVGIRSFYHTIIEKQNKLCNGRHESSFSSVREIKMKIIKQRIYNVVYAIINWLTQSYCKINYKFIIDVPIYQFYLINEFYLMKL